jgi:DNA polymerase-3 subunit epsilon
MNNQLQTSAFVAIDFETADRTPESACAVALVRVEGLEIVKRDVCLLRPPRNHFVFTYYHGIRWKDVVKAPTFGEAWPELSRVLHGAEFLAAHYAPFDQRVLNACCRAACLKPPDLPFICTVQLARQHLGIRPAKLPNVCARLGLPLDHHHEALCDAEACARIIIKATQDRLKDSPHSGLRFAQHSPPKRKTLDD